MLRGTKGLCEAPGGGGARAGGREREDPACGGTRTGSGLGARGVSRELRAPLRAGVFSQVLPCSRGRGARDSRGEAGDSPGVQRAASSVPVCTPLEAAAIFVFGFWSVPGPARGGGRVLWPRSQTLGPPGWHGLHSPSGSLREGAEDSRSPGWPEPGRGQGF